MVAFIDDINDGRILVFAVLVSYVVVVVVVVVKVVVVVVVVVKNAHLTPFSLSTPPG